jgi:hypothetical protein
MIVNSVIQSANLLGYLSGERVFRFQFSNIRCSRWGGFPVYAAVVDEGTANAPRDDWDAKRTNSIGSRALSRSHSGRFH